MSRWRHVRAIVLLPGMVTIVVPALLLAGDEVSLAGPVAVALGAVLIAGGVAMWAWTARLLARIGKGTLAPWDPTSHLVVEGPYRHVRNPMITAVLAVLLGEALVFASTPILVWCAVVFATNWVFFLGYEEPALEDRFGDEYRAYKRAVPRWIPWRRAA